MTVYFLKFFLKNGSEIMKAKWNIFSFESNNPVNLHSSIWKESKYDEPKFILWWFEQKMGID